MSSQFPFELLSIWDASLLAKATAGVFALVALIFVHSQRRSSLPLPPGPPASLLLGNLFDMSPKSPWLKWTEWARSYGDIVHLQVFGQHIIVLSSLEACDELLVRRGANYSDRPNLTMANLSGLSSAVGLVSQNDALRAMRRLYTPLTSPRQVLSFIPLVEHTTHGFLRKLSSTTDESTVTDLLRWLTGGNILKIAYGYTIEEKDDPFVRNAEISGSNFSKATTPGWLVDAMPFLRHLPVWTPGATFLRQAALWNRETEIMYDEPFNWVRQRIATGDYPSQSLIAKPLEQSPDNWMLDVIKYSMGSIYGAGSDTTVFAQLSFFLAMTLHPDIQRRAQAEIDAVTGGSRLPTYEDRPSLSYVNAIVKEIHRWNPVTPAGFPRASRTEDEYRGWRIPAGSTVIANVWHLTHDATRYADPMSFNPDRFVGPNPEPNPTSVAFGFGRRICPGRHLADISLFLTVACTLATFNINKQVNQDGVEIVPEAQYSGEIVNRPVLFPFKVTPRSEHALAILKHVN